MVLGMVAAVASAVAFGVAALLQATAARREARVEGLDPRLVLRMLRQGPFLVALALNILGYLLHLVALRTLPLFLAQAVVSASVAVTALLAARWLRTPLTWAEGAAVVGVVGGLALLTTAAAETGTVSTETGQRALLLVGVAVCAVAGALVARLRGRTAGALLGLVAGLSFSVGAVATRVLPDFAPSTLVTDPSVYTQLAAGGLGFLLYSTALQRAGVVPATSTLVIAQTVVPALVGIFLLGDELRAFGWPLLVVGLAMATVGAVALSRFDASQLSATREAAERGSS